MATPSAETYQSMTVEALRDCLAAAKAELEARASIMYEPDEHAQMGQDLIVLDRLRRVKEACERELATRARIFQYVSNYWASAS